MDKSNIVLCGFMASGKTTVGKLLADLTGMELVDTDRLIEQDTGMKIKEIFKSKGEDRFREMERRKVVEVSGMDGLVIAVGGGAVLDSRNVEDLKRKAVVYLLEVSPEDVVRRTRTDERPLLAREATDIESLLRSREQAYLDASDVVVGTKGKSPGEIAGEIADDFFVREAGR